MDFDVESAVRQGTAQLEALRLAEETTPQDIDTAQLMPLLVPTAFCTKTNFMPYWKLLNPDVGLMWCVLMDGGIVAYVNRRYQAYWEANGIDWQALAHRNLIDRFRRQPEARLLQNSTGELVAVKFQSGDGLGSSRLLLRGALSKWFPRGYQVAILDRNYGLAYSGELGPDDLGSVRKLIDLWRERVPQPFVSCCYTADDLLPENPLERELLLAQLQPPPAAPTALSVVLDAYRRGDYEEAIRAAEGLRRKGEVTASYCYFRGANQAHLGRLEEAEVWLRRNLAMRDPQKEKRHLAVGLTTLGQLALQGGRFDDAQEYFEKSLEHLPERGAGYRFMAELCLLRGSPSAALSWARLAITHEQADRGISLDLLKTNLGEDMAILAWATAAASRSTPEVSRLAAEAVANASAGGVASRAQVHYHCARAYAELGDYPLAAQHYAEAARLDPKGHRGRVAEAALPSNR